MGKDMSFRTKSLLYLFFFMLVAIVSAVQYASAADKNAILAEVGPYKLDAKTFEEQIKSLPPQLQMMVAQNPQAKEQLVERWTQITLLAMKARDMKLDQDPEVKSRIEDLKNSLLAQEIIRKEIDKDIPVSDQEAKEFYEKNKAEFSQPEMIKARHILIRPQGNSEKAWKEAEAKAKDIKKKLEKGADFAQLAKQYSEDPGTKDKGGELGLFPKGRMVPEFEKAAFALKVGEISAPVKTQFGYHIIKVEEKKPAETKPLKDVMSQVKQMVKMEKQQNELEKLIDQIKTKYPVKIHKDAISALQVESPAQTQAVPHPTKSK
ncbi:peptidylprolyl isomerase [Dissulfurimicrobium hydrothermale]|uniref:peptidylprolyl isomerase n=1 Tax=Dissulfurimicrobium hydrothermale TaxID=1750598 RepID=UPI001EDC546C|nr:peptidylprolyl isomerase [Dissulfurimicrobium hydrothermale]UKL13953.1 peptidylprolyl isomerase [Dissulfurimicrobium hydrothermale]